MQSTLNEPSGFEYTADKVRRRVTRSSGLTEDQRGTVRRMAPQERQNNPTKDLAESFNRHVTQPSRALSESRYRQGGADELGEAFEARLIEQWRRGSIQIHGDDGISIDEFTRRTMAMNKGKLFERVMRDMYKGVWDRRLQEHVVDGIGLSQYQRYIDTVIRLGTMEMCSSVSVAPILSLLGRVQVNCGQNTLASNPVLVDIRNELGPMAEDEQTPFFGLGDPVETKIPDRHKIKFAYAIKREAVCNGLDQTLREIMGQGAQLLDEYWAPHIIQMLFDLYVSPTDNQWAFELDGTRWRTFYQPQTTEGMVPYENLIYNQNDIQRLNYSLFVAIENLAEGLTDFRTGKPVGCLDTFQIIGTGRQQSQYIREALGAVTLSRATGGVGNEVMEFGRGARDGWEAQAFTSVWIKKYLHEFHAQVNTGWSKAQREQAIQRTLLAGNPRMAATVTTEWERERSPMPIDWANFNQEIIWGVKFMEKTGLAWKSPQHVVGVKGLPDGETIPTPDFSPIA